MRDGPKKATPKRFEAPRTPWWRDGRPVMTAGLLLANLALGTGQAEAQATQLPGIIVEGATLGRVPAPRTPVVEVRETAPAPVVATLPPGIATPAQLPLGSVAPGAGSAAGPDIAPGSGRETATGVPLSEIGSAVSVVTGEELRARQIRHAADALRSLPGVTVTQTSSPASVTEVRIRGAESNHTLVMIDGVVANDPTNGAFDFSDLSTADIDRIEVIRGAQSVIYGSGAIGGAINIVTRSGRGPARVTVSTEGGSFGTRDLALGLSGGSATAWGSLSYHARAADGFNIAPAGRERDASSLETFAFRGGVQVTPGLVLDGSLRHTRKSGDRDGFGGPPGALATAVDDPSTFTSNVLLGSLRARWDMANGWLTHELKTTYSAARSTDTDLAFPAFPFRSIYESEARTYSYLSTLRLPGEPSLLRHSLTGVVEWSEESFTPLGDFTDGLKRSRDRMAFAAEWRGSIANQLHLVAGARRDDTSAFGDFDTWRTSASWVMGASGLRPHASAGTGFKAPTFFEQFGSIPAFFIPNPNLTPEETLGWDAGIEWTTWRGRLVLDATYFSADLTNKIARNPAGFAPTLVNLPGTSTREGIELSARLKVAAGITLGGAYTYLDARNPDGAREIRRPPHAGRADLDAQFLDGRGRFNLAAIYNGRMDDIAFRLPAFTVETVALDAQWRLTAAIAYKLTPQIEVFGRVENLLDQRIQEVYGFNQPGIAAYTGMRISLGGERLMVDWK